MIKRILSTATYLGPYQTVFSVKLVQIVDVSLPGPVGRLLLTYGQTTGLAYPQHACPSYYSEIPRINQHILRITSLTLLRPQTPKYSEGPDKISHNAVFHQGLHCRAEKFH